ncbi:unnamed protein product [Rotaria magnacalcarata]|uniref:Uncharacterized protein n=1 Tax=Rotaria magnacalcarata TaxID=392030 RepID=A0A816U2Z8_9BILA|nr:unnamed protein product [Rotaria magnacalcarata]CAF1460822.1 unnamed protein product [Rotaria magnacalcarata]CAF2105034.1 unnamed protein product [Rotaria magnacalcarata]CAF3957530.1 unnamed protein product [Rotaria magnacalcarata]CAF4888403.1 unnamed protein product [Rotaria magnacalcarata]
MLLQLASLTLLSTIIIGHPLDGVWTGQYTDVNPPKTWDVTLIANHDYRVYSVIYNHGFCQTAWIAQNGYGLQAPTLFREKLVTGPCGEGSYPRLDYNGTLTFRRGSSLDSELLGTGHLVHQTNAIG